MRTCLIGVLVLLAAPGLADEESEVLFLRRVQPLLQNKCFGCHDGRSAEEVDGELDLSSSATMLKGGASEQPSVVVGKPDESPLYLAASRQSDHWSPMPPKDSESLQVEELAALHRWIETGAQWPTDTRQGELQNKYRSQWDQEDGVRVATSLGTNTQWNERRYRIEDLWAFQPLATTASDDHDDDKDAVPHDVDRLIQARFPEGLVVAERADRRTLIRRLSYDLTGLPPTKEEVARFLSDPRDDPSAFSALVEHYLASPHYGERMAQHWLDVVRYADSAGLANDYDRGSAWRYRDYVIRAFNNDKPFDQFILEQIAGDELCPEDPEAIIATGFLRMGPWELTGMEVPRIARQRYLDDVTNIVGETFLAQPLQCARCHDHKFDPIPTRDYYAIQAVFATTQLAERPAPFLPDERLDGFNERELYQRSVEEHEATLDRLDTVLMDNASRWFEEAKVDAGPWEKVVTDLQQSGRRRLFDAARHRMKQQGFDEQEYPPKLVGFTTAQFGQERIARKGLERLRWTMQRFEPVTHAVYSGRTPTYTSVTSPLNIPAVEKRLEEGILEQTCILRGGDVFAASDPVDPGYLSVIGDLDLPPIPQGIEGRRAAFARWVASANNPLTSRVIVNRVWMWHFGKPLAGNPNNFGVTGARPTHPELLDWLAKEFVADGWSIKSLHRLILNSDAYCRGSGHDAPDMLREVDPEQNSYAVFLPRRLSAEEIRDTYLASSGDLNRAIGGIPCRPEIHLEVALQPRQVMGTFAAAWVPNQKPSDRQRRSLYIQRIRGLAVPELEVFNLPSTDFSTEQRAETTVATQALNLINSKASHRRAVRLATVLLQQTASDEEALRLGYQRLFQRLPTTAEEQLCMQAWQALEEKVDPADLGSQQQPLKIQREAIEENTGERFSFTEALYGNENFVSEIAWGELTAHQLAFADICLALFNSNELLYVY